MRAPITDKHLLEMMWERFPEIMQRGAEQPDKGPWHVGVTRNDSRVYLQSNDFKHDVRLYVDGDFADLKQRIEYAERLKRNMNGEDHPAQRTWVGLTDAEWMNIVNKDHAWFGQRPEDVAHEVAKLIEAKLKEKNT